MNHPFLTATDRFDHDLINLATLPQLKTDLRYNGANNFMKEDLYLGFDQAYLHRLAYDKMKVACELLKNKYPQYFFLVLDALRPRSVQVKMRKFVENTPYQEYVADPKKGSLHNFGMAIDLTLIDENDQEFDMGTPFDDFSDLSQPQLEAQFLKEHSLTPKQHSNRMILRKVMLFAGFTQLAHEWWHYNAFDGDFVRKNFPIIE